jgi:hypothetical protein
MRAQQIVWRETEGWSSGHAATDAHVVLYFGARQRLADGERFRELCDKYPRAHVVGCSTGGQIENNDVTDDAVAALAIHFDATAVRTAVETITNPDASRACGQAIGRTLLADDLSGIFVLSDGLNINGSDLVAGITGVVGDKIPLTGGLAGDGSLFRETLVGANCVPKSHAVAALGFYGSAIRIGHGSAGGWDVFGPRRRINRSKGHVLAELDGEPALDLYERYLGEEANGLPGTALLFPLQISHPDRPDHELVRTVLAVDRPTRSMTFAGDMPEGWNARLMRGNFDRLAAGAADAARLAQAQLTGHDRSDQVAILISCIGRRLLMGQRITDEVEAAGSELSPHTQRIGFYSYGEISPHAVSGHCELHNQTMTVTTISEAMCA